MLIMELHVSIPVTVKIMLMETILASHTFKLDKIATVQPTNNVFQDQCVSNRIPLLILLLHLIILVLKYSVCKPLHNSKLVTSLQF